MSTHHDLKRALEAVEKLGVTDRGSWSYLYWAAREFYITQTTCPVCGSKHPKVCNYAPEPDGTEGPHLHGVSPQGGIDCCPDEFHSQGVDVT